MNQSAKLAASLTYYGLEACAWCRATGVADDAVCPACGGKGNILTLQPGVVCTKCKGSGKNLDQSIPQRRCIICEGSGWLATTRVLKRSSTI
jgi:DnaJ-class molecular chaperone